LVVEATERVGLDQCGRRDPDGQRSSFVSSMKAFGSPLLATAGRAYAIQYPEQPDVADGHRVVCPPPCSAAGATSAQNATREKTGADYRDRKNLALAQKFRAILEKAACKD